MMKLAIVHDYLNQMGGAERVLIALHEIFPSAPIYTSIYAPDLVDPAFREMDVRTTFMQRLPLVHHHHQAFLPIFPFAFESIDLREYDVVLSMSSGWAKNVLTRPETCHVCYCLTPMRFAWSSRDYAKGERISDSHREERILVDDEHFMWKFNGEYWKDELGYYRFKIQSKCPKKGAGN